RDFRDTMLAAGLAKGTVVKRLNMIAAIVEYPPACRPESQPKGNAVPGTRDRAERHMAETVAWHSRPYDTRWLNEHRKALRLLQDQQTEERLANRKRLPPFPTIEEWLRANRDPVLAALWTHPERFMRLEGDGTCSDRETRVYSILGLRSVVRGAYVHYCKLADPEHIAFSDRGDWINVCDTTDREIILASLQLAASRWDQIKIIGTDEFKARVVDLAVKRGFRLKNEDLRQTVEKRCFYHS
ncbi:hypothetical protein HK13_14795, partial [Acetobacter indonesiensis]|uniref:LPD7 domain-containing protein n=1 Tax=Acetobacter indonesiensis TaxID=104101 RepID=UPI000B71D87A